MEWSHFYLSLSRNKDITSPAKVAAPIDFMEGDKNPIRFVATANKVNARTKRGTGVIAINIARRRRDIDAAKIQKIVSFRCPAAAFYKQTQTNKKDLWTTKETTDCPTN